MKYVLTSHAEKRMKERSISTKLLGEALKKPTKVSYDRTGKILLKKLYKKRGTERLLLIVGEYIAEVFKIITIIDTSKVKKYL